MKRRDLIKLLERNGWWLRREGSDHSIYTDGKHNEPVPRQTEIDERLARKIISRRGLK
ncbi:MAG: type II toxin-antitoxin system HicA family toxin [Clostridia bacterium]|nr:type II toxin-antitoxin system HicA family toxin [Clostridia bacterium]